MTDDDVRLLILILWINLNGLFVCSWLKKIALNLEALLKEKNT